MLHSRSKFLVFVRKPVSNKRTYAQRPLKNTVTPQKLTRKKKATGGKWLLIGLGLGVVATISATAGALLAVSLSATPLLQSKLSPKEQSAFSQTDAVSYKNLQIPTLSRPINLLVLGTKVLTSDVKEASSDNLGYHALVNSFDGLSDTMLLLRFNADTGKFTALSIPRDTQAEIEGYGVRKINEANSYGGPALAAQSVSNLLDGVPVDRYVRVNVQGIAKLVDALGGVEIYVPKDMKYNDFSQHFYVNLKQGKQRLDGEKAVQFLRFRYDEYGDIGRIQRQQALIRAVVEQSLKPQTLLKLPEILSVIQAYVDTNLTIQELVALAGFASQTQRSDVQMLMLPGGFNGDGRHGVSYWLPNQEAIQKLVAQHFDQGYAESTDTDPSRLRIAIQDSTDNPEAVRTVVNALTQAGYRNVYVGEPWREPLQVSRIVAQKGDDGSAAALRVALGVGEVLVESTGNLASDVTIQLGQDWQH
jgi:LCP family protein required for cell wall assembly